LKGASCTLLQMSSELFVGRLHDHAEVKKRKIGPLQRPPPTQLLDYPSLFLPMMEARAFRPRWMLIFTFDSDMP
jgi:hypothetical protein